MKTLLADRIAGVILFVIGGLAVFEAIRLYPLHIGRSIVGDETFIGFLGVALMILGGLFIFVFKPQGDRQAEFPTGELRKKMLLVTGLLFAYWVLLQVIGYTASTFIIGLGLFRTMSAYGWLGCTVFAAVLTMAFYGLFVMWLQSPFPEPSILLWLGR
ncbi:tripartite tricarboxylate transporter TctB family protein [Desulfosporosinus shakirovi]|uniref:tripartite tricarboxylate transporter TctB family protein n=1 Tax=Desulfosporosinus shakirovi TaxID=2885154 RepID=UPI001E2B6A34|nr:tripartite tricarboxylate transporter TctB family protein [Desulfosporosinus sp. SRJS8]MCB8816706.1 tripartite tricarboxylate transporter TctB family protein [Desulfosporosinus sp. SRJS8]